MFSLFRKTVSPLEQALDDTSWAFYSRAMIACHGILQKDPDMPEAISALKLGDADSIRQFTDYLARHRVDILYLAFDFCILWAYIFERFYYREFKDELSLDSWRKIFRGLIHALKMRFTGLKHLSREFDPHHLDQLLKTRYTTYAQYEEVVPEEDHWYESIFGQFQKVLEEDYHLEFYEATMAYARAYSSFRSIDIMGLITRLKPLVSP